ncbi:MAG: T9SS type A sorting domain-containing protein [Saprospiraceae bacterium]|nr:T9SS type A sorting domain-containing protein [Saprospiraceae bacterium]
MRQLVFIATFWALATCSATAQVALFTENFNACSLPAGWEVNSIGNQNPVWYVGDANQNDDNNGQSMNGSCFLFVDDDATGDQTPAYVIDFVSPPFDASQHPVVELSVDVHYRDWGQSEEYFDVLITDGVQETLIRRYDKNRSTGGNLYEFETLVFDLSLVTQSPNVRLIFRYDDAGGFAWWAGVDNISVVGKGQGVNVITESFNGCEKPGGWETQVVTGVDDWKFGVITEGVALGGSNSMNGSCFAFFDDDFIGPDTPYSTIRLVSPWFDGTQFGQFNLNFDVILRYATEKIAVIVQNGFGEEFIVRESSGDVGGPFFQNYVNVDLDLSPYRSQQMRVIFEYDDGQGWGWWVGIDNVKVTGFGAANDICVNAVPVTTGTPCTAGNNANALLDGPDAPCVEKSMGGLWYSWTADFTGTARLHTQANFNDVVNIFSGDCSSPQLLLCDNRDEHGFTGENTYFQVQSGTSYLIRISGREGGFGISRGEFCIAITQVAAPPAVPANDECSQAIPLELGATCAAGNNRNGATSAMIPSLNELARHDVWYTFVAPALAADEVLEIRSNADFSDVITLYSGDCGALTEVAGNHKGHTLESNSLTAGQTYYVQISGTFATIEGAVCPQIQKKNVNAPPNDNCLAAITIHIGDNCTSGSNIGATFSGIKPPCVVNVAHDVWYQFTAPASGAVRINTGADFPHVLTVWKGDCGNFDHKICAENPLRCNGFLTLGALSAGETYYLQIASQIAAAGPATGEFCLQILDGAQPAPFEALQLQVTEKCVSTNISELLVQVIGGVPPYTYQGNLPGELLPSGTHYLGVVADANGCETAFYGQTEDCQALPCAVTGVLTAIQPLCHDAANGALSVMVTGGTGAYSYQWSNGASNASLSGLTAGAYAVTVRDAVDCELVLTDTLLNPAAITAVPTSIEQPHQGLSDGAIFVDVAGGDGQFDFAWLLNGQAFVNSEDLTNAAAGDYTLVVTDGNGCAAAFDFTLTETVGNQDVSTAFFTEVFPNPAQEKAWLAVSFPTVQSLHLTMTDAAGRIIHAWTVRNVTEQNIPLDLRGLPAGTYRLQIRTEKETLFEKVIVGNSGIR